MPFKKQKDGSYKSPSGRRFTSAQVRLYYATDGFQHSVSTQPIGQKGDKSRPVKRDQRKRKTISKGR